MAECLTAWARGEESSAADAGGMHLAEAFSNLDVIAKVAVAFAKAHSK